MYRFQYIARPFWTFMNGTMALNLDKPLPPSPTGPQEASPRGMPWWEVMLAVLVMGATLFGVAHQFHKLVMVQQRQEAAYLCQGAGALAASDRYRDALPNRRFYGITTAVDRTEGNDGRFWREATPTFLCRVDVMTRHTVLDPREDDGPVPFFSYQVSFTGFPTADRLARSQFTAVELSSTLPDGAR